MGKGLSKSQVAVYAVFGTLGVAALIVTIALVSWKLTRPHALQQHTKVYDLFRLSQTARQHREIDSLVSPQVTHTLRGIPNLKRTIFHEAAERGIAVTEDAMYHMPSQDSATGRIALHPARYDFSCGNSLHLASGETLVLVAYFRKDQHLVKLCVFGLAPARDTWHLLNHVVISCEDPVMRILIVNNKFGLQRNHRIEFWDVQQDGTLQQTWATHSVASWGVPNGGYVTDHDGLSTVSIHDSVRKSTQKHSFQDLGSRLNAASVSGDGLALVLFTGWQMWFYQRKSLSSPWTNVHDKNLMLPKGIIVHLSVTVDLTHMLVHVINPDEGSARWLWYANNKFVCFERAFANKFHTQGLHPQAKTPHVCITEMAAAFGDTVRRFGVL